MQPHRRVETGTRRLRKTATMVLLAVAAGLPAARAGETGANVVIWDTLRPFGETADVRDRTGWKPVPTDLLTLEADPPKASSDPGYYGRPYPFKGEAVVENGHLTAVFWSGKGKVVVTSKADPGLHLVECLPLQTKTKPGSIARVGVLRNTGDEAALDVAFSAGSAVFSFDKTPIIEIKPAGDMKGVSLLGQMAHGIVPGFVGDDLIINPGPYASTGMLAVPTENVFLGLLKGESGMLAVTWPNARQRITLGLGSAGQQERLIESIDFAGDGQSLYLAVLEAPGIWHREELKPDWLEKDVTANWKRPFPAKWITQLYEGDLKTAFALRETKGQIWRGVAGMYLYPIWFEGDSPVYHLSKKVPPKGESIIYFLEGKGTPASIFTPIDIMKATLGRPMCDGILDPAGRTLRIHHRRGAEGIRRACTCGCTEAIEAVFKAGEETGKKDYVEGAVGDMVFFVTEHMKRIDEYRAFADDMIKSLSQAESSQTQLKPFLDNLEQIVQQIPQEYAVQKENIKSLEYADELARKTSALIGKKDPKNLPTCLELGKAWRGMGGAQDGLLAEYHIIVRRLFQEAGYGCMSQPGAVELAQEIRQRCRRCLRNPDGYEIWPNY